MLAPRSGDAKIALLHDHKQKGHKKTCPAFALICS